MQPQSFPNRLTGKQKCLRDLKNSEAAILFFDKEKTELQQTIIVAKKDIQEAYLHPAKFGKSSTNTPKAQFYLGTFLLFTVAIYLSVFYISTFYSAFFKNFTTDSLIHAMFDVRAFGYAPHAGTMQTAIVIGTILLLLGMAQTVRVIQYRETLLAKLSLSILFSCTFLLNAILAYHIVKKINALTQGMATRSFNIQDAIFRVEFWVIIGSGFAAYMIWGLIFDITNQEHGHISTIKKYVAIKQQEITEVETAITEINQELDLIRNKINIIKRQLLDFDELSEMTKPLNECDLVTMAH